MLKKLILLMLLPIVASCARKGQSVVEPEFWLGGVRNTNPRDTSSIIMKGRKENVPRL